MKIFSADETRERLPFDRLIEALRARFAQGCEVPARHVHDIAGPDGTVTSLLMPAWIAGQRYGVKIVNIAPGNASRGLPAVQSSYVLHDATTGVALAMIDGGEITARRTAAASALAASWLARGDARHLAVVGAGRVARLLPEAYAVVRGIDRVTVWARSAAQAAAFVDALRGRGIDAHAASSVEAAVRDADIVSCATLAAEPLVRGEWLEPGSHLDLIGGFTPAMREADDACFAHAAIHIDTPDALRKSGDLLGPIARGVFAASDVRGTLQDLARGLVTGRRSPVERTVFKSVGTALEDLAAAMLVCETPDGPSR